MAGEYTPIADYGIIGDCHTAALVSRGGSIDWFCPGRFDAMPVFCRLLDAQKGGYCSISPESGTPAERRYLPHTNVLETLFHCEGGGEVLLTDLMPISRRSASRIGHDVGTSRQVLRLIEAREADSAVRVRFKPTFDFARGETELEIAAGKGAVGRQGGQHLVLYCPKLRDAAIESDGTFSGIVDAAPGERTWLALTLAASEQDVYRALDPNVSVRDLQRTADYWTSWCGACFYRGPYEEPVLRSALTLKLLIYEPTGALVAAPTTSLPEFIGGVRNWDYRYTWLRDASLMLYALSTLGYHEEATDFVSWLAQTCGTDPAVTPQIMYTLDGKRELPEFELSHLEGYKGSSPVRAGNAASDQHQLDIYGDVMSAAYHFRHTVEADESVTPVPEAHERMSRRNWHLLRGLVEEAVAEWQKPDSGIWEVRGGPRHYVYSKLMCWTALDRGIRLAQEQDMPAPVEQWQAVREEIRSTILERGYNAELGAFTQALDGHELDASVLAIPRVGFLPATDERVQSTVNRIRERLTREGLVERYHAEDGLPGDEGTFALCSFWMVDTLAQSGRLEEARELYDVLLGYRNDLGLLSEELDPVSETDRMLGNFPQGFSHMALIGSAVNISQAQRYGAEHTAHTEPERALRGRSA